MSPYYASLFKKLLFDLSRNEFVLYRKIRALACPVFEIWAITNVAYEVITWACPLACAVIRLDTIKHIISLRGKCKNFAV